VISKSGQFFIKAENSFGCQNMRAVTVVINQLPTINAIAQDSLCIGLSTDIKVELSGDAPWSFSYNDGSQNHYVNNINRQPYLLRVTPNQTTTYTITSVSDRHCTNRTPDRNKVTIHITKPIPGIRLNAVNARANTPTQLKGRNIPSYTYNWVPRVGLNAANIPNPVFNFNQQVEYKVNMLSSAGCLTVDTLLVRVINATEPDSPCDFFMPNAFSPNGDGKNDTYFPFTINIKEIKFFRIFNRWGELVFETKGFGEGWNGMYKNKLQPADVYVWTAEAICEDGTPVKRSGNVILLK
jgi:gliding motility-associated-like protein